MSPGELRIVALVGIALYGVAIALAVMSYDAERNRLKPGWKVWRYVPYLAGLTLGAYYWIKHQNLIEAVLLAAIILGLTFIAIWGIKNQWYS